MGASTGLVLAAGGIAAVNEVVFAPVNPVTTQLGGAGVAADALSNFNWKIIPATLVLALIFGGFETVSPEFAKILAGTVLLSVLIVPVGKAPSPLENIAKALGS